MSIPVAIIRERRRLAVRARAEALIAVGCARVLARLPPRHLRAILMRVSIGARPAGRAEALAARQAVVSVSTLCAGQGCLPRSIAAALLCRARGSWPGWCVGVRTAPFAAHAWIEADGDPVGEPLGTESFRRVIVVARQAPPSEAVR